MGKQTEGSGARGTERDRTARIKLPAQSAASGIQADNHLQTKAQLKRTCV
jgi:hypothetical protein